MNMTRRELFAAFAAGAVVTAEGLWFPGTKLISIPAAPIALYDVLDCGTWRRVHVEAACAAINKAMDEEIYKAFLNTPDINWFSLRGQ